MKWSPEQVKLLNRFRRTTRPRKKRYYREMAIVEKFRVGDDIAGAPRAVIPGSPKWYDESGKEVTDKRLFSKLEKEYNKHAST